MSLSYWEYKSWFCNVDFTVVGSGIVGLNCALTLAEQYPNAKIVVLERGVLPQGASTKNAGFACFGSLSELLSDLVDHKEEEVVQLVKSRKEGIDLLRRRLGDRQLGFRQCGGHELFLKEHEHLYESSIAQIPYMNNLLQSVFDGKTFMLLPNDFNFAGICEHYITHFHEGQLDAGAMMQHLLLLARNKGIQILNGIEVCEFSENNGHVLVRTQLTEFKTTRLYIATNGFAAQLLKENVRPARAQVLITEPIAGLKINGTFHLDRGYYYFRNVDGRILLGGGRNLDFATEETYAFGTTQRIQSKLGQLLDTVVLPGQKVKIERQWSGIMGVGPNKKPIIKRISNRVACGVRMGGMGVAIGAKVGEKLARTFH